MGDGGGWYKEVREAQRSNENCLEFIWCFLLVLVMRAAYRYVLEHVFNRNACKCKTTQMKIIILWITLSFGLYTMCYATPDALSICEKLLPATIGFYDTCLFTSPFNTEKGKERKNRNESNQMLTNICSFSNFEIDWKYYFKIFQSKTHIEIVVGIKFIHIFFLSAICI